MREVTTLGDLARNGRVSVNDGYRTRSDQLGKPGVPILRVAEVQDGFINPSFGDHVLEELRPKFGPKASAAGDVVVTTKGTVGRVARIRHGDPEFVYSPQVCFFRSIPDSGVLADWLYYWFRSPEFVAQALGVQSQTDMAAYINLADMRALTITLPDLTEQRAIAAVLGALDDKIESNRRLWSLSLRVLHAGYVANTSDETCRPSTLGDVAAFNASTRKPGTATERLVYVDIAGVSPGVIERRQVMTWGDAPGRARRGVVDGDVAFSTVRPGRRSFCVFIDPDPETVVSTGFAVMSPTKVGTAFLLAAIASPSFAEYCETVAEGSTYPAVSPASMGAFELTLPKASALEDFEAEYMPILRRGHLGLMENVALSELRDALLPELLSGRMRIRNVEAIAEEVA